MSSTNGTAPVPWEERTSDDIGEKAVTETYYECLPKKRPTFVRFTGKCPACEHSFLYEHPLEYLVVKGIFKEEPKELAPVLVICSCTEPHARRPQNELGCGAYWKVEVSE